MFLPIEGWLARSLGHFPAAFSFISLNVCLMTHAQLVALRDKWQLRGDSVKCHHPNLELESHDDGYVTGQYHCLACGESVIKALNR
jgi:hypothetical protein